MNAKRELLQFLREENLTLKCAEVYCLSGCAEFLRLNWGHSRVDLAMFLDEIDFNYAADSDPSPGGDFNLKGTLWFKDGSWAERGYDGYCRDEIWEHRVTPTIQPHLWATKGD
jgi:hypothetical protein